MEQFGAHLRDLRLQAGWRQIDLAEHLGNGISRPVIANVEAGRHRPSERLWAALSARCPEWVEHLAPSYESERATARRPVDPAVVNYTESPTLLGGPYVVEALNYIYVFRHSRAPEEIIETRRVRAIVAGPTGYGLRFTKSRAMDQPSDSVRFAVDQENLWGGYLTELDVTEDGGQPVYLQRFEFGKRLRKGQVHEFGIRTWINHDPEPGTGVEFALTIPAAAVSVHLLFKGPDRPRDSWLYTISNDPDAARETKPPQRADDPDWLVAAPDGSISHTWRRPSLRTEYGLGWRW